MGVALVGPGRAAILPEADEIVDLIERLRQRGIQRAVTPALSKRDAQPFLRAGFTIHETLHLLGHDLTKSQGANGYSFAPQLDERFEVRPGRRWHESEVIDVDGAAFEPFWRFDAIALREARRATPRHRYRVAVDAHGVQGYAVTGLAGQRGYLQRLAVHPRSEGNGLGRVLVADAFEWLRRRGATRIMVNTQQRNDRALKLYNDVGFVSEPSGLVVLEWGR